jgi:glycosyltransferase involved in cell wall biosynthesis
MVHYITTNGVGNAWVGNELRTVGRAGIPFVLHALRRPSSTFFAAAWAHDLDAATKAIYPLAPFSSLLSFLLAPLLFGGRFFAALANALFGERESFRARVAGLAHFYVACHWARGLRHAPVSLIHAQWVHSSGTVGMYGAWLLAVPFSFTGHAADLFRDRVALRDKIRRASTIICISEFHRAFFKENGARDEQLRIVYCGIDPAQFSPGEGTPRDSARDILRIGASGRLVEKKGFAHLVRACAALRQRGVRFECTIAGSGPLRDALQGEIDRLGVHEKVRLTAREIKQEEIPEFMRARDAYVLPCVWSSDNDVDGLPQMLMEAMACEVPVISTRLVGIPDLVVHDRTGLLADPGNVDQLVEAIVRLNDDPVLARRLARAGREWVEEKFDIRNCLQPLIAHFQRYLTPIETPAGARQLDPSAV